MVAVRATSLRSATMAATIATMAISSDGNKAGCRGGLPRRRRQEAAGRQIQQIEALQPERHRRADEARISAATISLEPARARAIQQVKNAPPTPANSPR